MQSYAQAKAKRLMILYSLQYTSRSGPVEVAIALIEVSAARGEQSLLSTHAV